MSEGQAQYFTCVMCNYHCKIDEDTVKFLCEKKFEGMEFPETFQ